MGERQGCGMENVCNRYYVGLLALTTISIILYVTYKSLFLIIVLRGMQQGDSRIKTLFLSHIFPNRYNPNYGIFAFQLVQNLSALGIPIVVIAPVPYSPPFLWFKKKWRAQGRIPWRECIDGVEVIYPRYFCLPGQRFIVWNTLFMYWSVYPIMRIMHRKGIFNIIHSYGVLPAGFVGQLTAARLNLLSACTVIGLDINVLAKKSAKAGALAKYVLEKAGQVITVGKDLASETNKLQVPNNRIKVIYNGVDSERFDLTNIDCARARFELGFSSGDRIILFVGRLVREKGIYELIEVFARVSQKFSEAILVIVGDGNEKEALVNLACKKGIKEKVAFAGNIPYKKLVWWYAASEIVALLSYYEGVPNVLKEAMSCGRAVVATRTAGITELVTDGETGILVEPGSIDQAVLALEKLLASSEPRRKMGIYARSLIREKQFSWKNTAEAYREVYAQLIK